ncbi:type I DNA topoisomerase [Siccirubricoccus sp. KC 17139]|uniref:DNA topoisomerase 1 n=1 Tax=Siccirubricoccus soli TaxID=2899147 RepID=A0ABT1D8C1_9PROT|nr:type I DNA topoisomerase [Siccirubricoccus soli]MCO6417434.1 type I DNA topoisomerase [Siccirubricoccus soli]MCP2683569.1 type I DNA topoisomerase [Siccirubricoccus soli]
MPDVVVVESPAKAKTINKYLGRDFTVLASFGHVRDLPPKDGSVRPEEDFAMDWESEDRGERQVNEIARALKGARRLFLATDPDREGEAISWHVREMLARKGALKGLEVRRITFNEITKRAIQQAIAHPRDLDAPLIDAYMARRALDYLVGFTLSPVLWRKLPGSRSAGRVQSVALRLICEREAEIEAFKAREYWTVEGRFQTPQGAPFTARLTHLNGKKLDQFDLPNEAAAMRAKAAVEAGEFSVLSLEKRRVKRHPPPPFTTSTLQMEASRKLGMGAQVTMRTAQQLYEGVEIGGETVGLITYMRTDGVQMAREAIAAIRDHVQGEFGRDYLPGAPREYQSKAKNAQEAHEAIRPTDVRNTPERVARYLDERQRRLYELIWKRAVASQMQSAELDQTTVEIADQSKQTILRATGSVIAFDGFLKLYREDEDDRAADARAGITGVAPSEDEESRTLPPMRERDPLKRGEVTASQHFTQPPPRYSEASLVKKLEELGIGRPSTYASILQTLQDRDYVKLEKRRFIPEDRGRLVTSFLVKFFERYVDTGFTAALEEQLDEISDGKVDWRAVMRQFWEAFKRAVDATKDLKISDVIDALDEELGPHFFPERGDGTDPRACPACGNGRLGLRLGRTGAFIGCSNYPDCRYTRPLIAPGAEGEGTTGLTEGPRELGRDPATGEMVTVRRGPYGVYVQLGEGGTDDRGKPTKPRRASLTRDMDPDTLDLERALKLLSLPRIIGRDPESGEEIQAGLGRFGPYIKVGSVFQSLEPGDDVLSLGMNRAMELLAKARAKVRVLGPHPKDGVTVEVKKGRFGPYAQHGKMVANLPRNATMEEITLEEAVTLLAEKGKELAPKGKAGAKGKAKPAPKRAAAAAEAIPTAPPAPRKAAAAKPKAKPAAKKAAPAVKKPAVKKSKG